MRYSGPYMGARTYARQHSQSQRSMAYKAYLERAEQENADAKAVLAGMQVGDPVFYDHEKGFRLELIITAITPTLIRTEPLDHSGPLISAWLFQGIQTAQPGALPGSSLTWPARLQRLDKAPTEKDGPYGH